MQLIWEADTALVGTRLDVKVPLLLVDQDLLTRRPPAPVVGRSSSCPALVRVELFTYVAVVGVGIELSRGHTCAPRREEASLEVALCFPTAFLPLIYIIILSTGQACTVIRPTTLALCGI